MAKLVDAPTALHETTLLEPGTVYATDMPNDATKQHEHYIFSNDGPIRPNFVDAIRTKKQV